MMSRMLFLLSYVGLGLALALGNRPVIEQDQKRNQNHDKMVEFVGDMDSVDGNALHLRSYQHDVPLRNNMYLYDGQSETNNNPPHSPTSVFNNERITKPLNYKNKWLDNLYSTVLNIMHHNDDVRRDDVPLQYEETPLFWQQQQQQQHGTRKIPEIWERREPEGKIYDYVEGPFVKNRFYRNNRISGRSNVAKPSFFYRSFNESDTTEDASDSPLTDQDRRIEPGSMNLNEDKSLGNSNKATTSTNREVRGVSKRHKQNLPMLPSNIASQVMLRSGRGNRQYDVPQIGEFYLFFNKF